MAPHDDEGFRVTDRRRRQDDEPVREPEPRRVEPARVEVSPTLETAPAREVASAPREEPLSAADASDRNLTGLFVMLASSAAMAMGEAPDPLTGQVHRDLGQAAEMVDLLVLLREKTEGNRTAEETQVLDELVYDVQVRYVAATRRSGRPPGPARP